MTDEKYMFNSDMWEKKNIARSARNKRTHTGKRGGVKLPSDYMTKKEIRAMSGEVQSYRLNDPMSWEEFKAMPDEHKVSYIKLLRQKWNVSDSKIAEMMGIGQHTVSNETIRLGIAAGKGKRKGFQKEAWYAWVNGVPIADYTDSVAEKNIPQGVEIKVEAPVCAAPKAGNLCFECPANQALDFAAKVLGGATVRLCISWESVIEGGINNEEK